MKVKLYLTKLLFSGGVFRNYFVIGTIFSTHSRVYAHQPPVNIRKMASAGDGKPSMKKEVSQTMRQLDQKKGRKKETETFPTTIEGFNYGFNEKGELRHLENGGQFEFAVNDSKSYNQKRYEALGEVITEKMYGLLETEGKLKKHYIPENSKKSEPCSFIFMSEDALTNEDKLMVIIHGSGVVRAGQWSRKLIINEDLSKGTQLPYIKRGIEEGYGIIVLNTNLNRVTINGKEQQIRGSEDPEAHGLYVWRTFIQKSKAKHIAIVGHSMGGVVTVTMAQEFLKDFQQRVFAIAFTDSVHGVSMAHSDAKIGKLLKQKAVNWVTSKKPLDTPMKTWNNDARRVSAGHEVHEWTSWAAFESVFKFFNQQYKQCIGEGSATAKDSSTEAKEAEELEVAQEAAEEEEQLMDTSDSKQEEEGVEKEEEEKGNEDSVDTKGEDAANKQEMTSERSESMEEGKSEQTDKSEL